MAKKISIAISVICAVLMAACIVVLVIAGVQGRTFGGLIASWVGKSSSPSSPVAGGSGFVVPFSPVSVTDDYQYTDRQERLMVTAAGYPTADYKVQVNADNDGYLVSITVTVPSWYTQVNYAGEDVRCNVTFWTMTFGPEGGGKSYTSSRFEVSDFGLTRTFTASELFSSYNGAAMDKSDYYVSCKLESSVMNYMTASHTISIASADSLPVPTKEGYTFGGWYMDEACTVPYNGSPILGDITLYAKMTINRYTVTYDVMGGDAMDAVILDWGSTINPPAPTREGYDFQGWYNGDTLWSADTQVKSDLTLTAHWSIKQLTVTLMMDGEVFQTVTVDYGKRFGAILAQAGLMYNKCVAIKMADGSEVAVDNSMALMADNVTLEMVPMTTGESVQAFASYNWWSLLLVGLSGAILIICAVIAARREA